MIEICLSVFHDMRLYLFFHTLINYVRFCKIYECIKEFMLVVVALSPSHVKLLAVFLELYGNMTQYFSYCELSEY